MKKSGKRDRVVIATKFLGGMYLGDPNGGGAHRKSMVSACEQSLRRLQTDYIDLYWMHFFDRHTPIDETVRALDDLVRSGKVRYVGFSDAPAWVCARAQTVAELRGLSPIIGLQIEYSLIERSVENDLLPMAKEMGMGVTPWSPLKGGILSGKYRRGSTPSDSNRGEWNSKKLNDRAYAIIDELASISQAIGSTPARVALAWLLTRPAVSSVIIGARTVAQLDDNLAAVDVTLSAEQLSRLDAVSKQDPIFPHGFLSFVTDNVQGGTTVNGIPSQLWALAPQSDAERW